MQRNEVWSDCFPVETRIMWFFFWRFKIIPDAMCEIFLVLQKLLNNFTVGVTKRNQSPANAKCVLCLISDICVNERRVCMVWAHVRFSDRISCRTNCSCHRRRRRRRNNAMTIMQ